MLPRTPQNLTRNDIQFRPAYLICEACPSSNQHRQAKLTYADMILRNDPYRNLSLLDRDFGRLTHIVTMACKTSSRNT